MSFKDQIKSILPDEGNMDACFMCGICASGCPATGLDDTDPRKFVRFLSMEKDDRILSGNWVWMCTTCNRCVHVCPMQVDIPSLVLAVRSFWPKEDRPEGIVEYCHSSQTQPGCSAFKFSDQQFKSVVEETINQVRKKDRNFEKLSVPIDKKKTMFFLNQSSEVLLENPMEMATLWKILDLAKADWTYGSKGWAAENYCMFLADDTAWKKLIAKKSRAIERLGAKVLLNTECGHDFFAIKKGLEKFDIPHQFEIKNIIELYAEWIRQGILKVSSDWNIDMKIKFSVQDPCQLVRKSVGDDIAEQLRFVIKKTVGEENFIEMTPNGSNNYCCGGGGGAICTDYVKERLAYGKVKFDQILETKTEFCITPCNNCYSQINALTRHYKGSFKPVYLWTVIGIALGIIDPSQMQVQR